MSYYSVAAEKLHAAGHVITGLHNASVSGELKRDITYDEVIRGLLLNAAPMFWAKDTATLVAESSRLLDLNNIDIQPSLLELKNAFCWFEQPVLYAGRRADMSGEDNRPIVALGWQWVTSLPLGGETKSREATPEEFRTLPKALHIQAFSGSIAPRPTISIFAPCGKGVVDFINDKNLGTNHLELAQFVIAANAFIRQRLLIVNSKPIERHARKRIGRLPDHWATIRIIHLRASQSTHPRRESSGPVEWACRWFVRGHWRNQRYKLGIRPRYVLPYLKGPDDKPIKPPATSIYAVTR